MLRSNLDILENILQYRYKILLLNIMAAIFAARTRVAASRAVASSQRLSFSLSTVRIAHRISSGSAVPSIAALQSVREPKSCPTHSVTRVQFALQTFWLPER
jgi:hypothetical protein